MSTPTVAPPTDRLLFNRTEAAARLGLSAVYVRQLEARGVLKTVRFGRHVMVPAAELERLAREGAPSPRGDL